MTNYNIIHYAGLGDTHNLINSIQIGEDVNLRGHFGMTPLMAASVKGNLECIKILLSNGADTKLRAKCGESAFMLAVKRKNYNVADLLKQYEPK